MANTMSKYGSNTNRPLSEIVGLSTDTKPTDSIEGIQIQNGSSFRELDTGKRFLFDAENTTWNEVSSGGGGGDLTDLIERDITSIDIPNTVTKIGANAFYGCTSLTSVTIPDTVTLIRSGAFRNCSGLTSIDIPISVKTIETLSSTSAFNGCVNLLTITIHKASGSIAGAPWGATNATVVWTG